MGKGYRFIEVTIVPPVSEKYYQLFIDGSPTDRFFSESHLKFCLQILDNYERTNNN